MLEYHFVKKTKKVWIFLKCAYFFANLITSKMCKKKCIDSPVNISIYLEFHFKEEIRKVPIFPHDPPPTPVDNFFNIHLTKNIIEYKRCRI